MSRQDPESLEEQAKALQARLVRIATSAKRAGWSQRIIWKAFVRFAERRLAR